MNVTARWQGWRLCMGWVTWTSTHHGQPGCSQCWGPTLPAVETNTESRHHSRGWSASYLMTGWLHWITSIMEGIVLCSYWNRHFIWIWICFPCIMPLPKLPSVGFQNALSTVTVFHTALLLMKELTSQQMKCSSQSMSMEFTGLTMLPHHPEIAGLIGRLTAFWRSSYSPATWPCFAGREQQTSETVCVWYGGFCHS